MENNPATLQTSPLPLVAVTSTAGEALVSEIVRDSSARAPSASRLRLRALSPDELRPRKEQRRTVYDGSTIVEGILRASWPARRASASPAVCAVVVKYDERVWREQLIALYEPIRLMLKYHNIKSVFIVVLPSPVQDTTTYEERLTALRKQLDVESRQIVTFVGEARQCMASAESVCIELAEQHYREEAQRLKSLSKNLPKIPNQSLLHVRLVFKMGYLAEFRRDWDTSLKHYNEAFESLREARFRINAVDERRETAILYELKTVAALVSYRITSVLLRETRNLGEAVGQFGRLMKAYGNASNPAQLEFVHHAWVATQNETFAHLLEATQSLLPKEHGPFHPAFYYRAAAKHTALRKAAAVRLCEPRRNEPGVQDARDDVSVVPLGHEVVEGSGYVGVLLRRKDVDPAADYEEQVNKFVAWELFVFDHCSHQLSLMLRAYDYFQGAEPSRLQVGWAADISELYFQKGQFAKAKQYCDLAIKQYRKDGWHDLLGRSLHGSRTYASELGQVDEYLAASFEMLQPSMPFSFGEKSIIQQEIFETLKPLDQNGPLSETVSKVHVTAPITLPLNVKAGLFSIQTNWSKATLCAGESSVLTVTLTSHMPIGILVSLIEVEFNNPKYNWFSGANSSEADQCFTLNPNSPKKFSSEIVAQDVMDLECERVVITLGAAPAEIKLVMTGFQTNSSRLRVLQHASKLSFMALHSSPALHGENFKCNYRVSNDDDADVHNAVVKIESPATRDGPCLYSDPAGTTPLGELRFDTIAARQFVDVCAYVKIGTNVSEKSVSITVEYDSTAGYHSAKTQQEWLAVQPAFVVKFSYYTNSLEPTHPQSGAFLSKDPFFLNITAQPTTRSDINIHSAGVNVRPEMACLTRTPEEKPSEPLEVSVNNRYNVWYRLKPMSSEAGELAIGEFSLQWSRVGSSAMVPLVVSVPKVRVSESLITATTSGAAVGSVGLSIPFIVCVTNQTAAPQECSVTIVSSSAFASCGMSRCPVLVSPKQSVKLPVALVPLLAGDHALPAVTVAYRDASGHEHPIQCAQRRVFVLPLQPTAPPAPGAHRSSSPPVTPIITTQ